ncbi:hypothetical protein DFP72DRAFT_849984 [Ephemerocybe angulata]|uniref:Uncharacterized protein n=1 Tax=Ephemerocybe angulata TaxID=980116 RepID=A0A8H6M537_9AGAR|nr:hypothetical protein DFP72DRAFT_849984 [Tulosesus angulatus]
MTGCGLARASASALVRVLFDTRAGQPEPDCVTMSLRHEQTRSCVEKDYLKSMGGEGDDGQGQGQEHPKALSSRAMASSGPVRITRGICSGSPSRETKDYADISVSPAEICARVILHMANIVGGPHYESSFFPRFQSSWRVYSEGQHRHSG